jgi:hypothetical protein
MPWSIINVPEIKGVRPRFLRHVEKKVVWLLFRFIISGSDKFRISRNLPYHTNEQTKLICMGKKIAFMLLIGGGAVIYSLMTATVNMPILIFGLLVLLIAGILFVREIAKI